jgi:hypothetical protein
MDRSAEIIADIIAVKWQRNLSYFIETIDANYKEYGLHQECFPVELHHAFVQYTRYLFHYFEVSPFKINMPH